MLRFIRGALSSYVVSSVDTEYRELSKVHSKEEETYLYRLVSVSFYSLVVTSDRCALTPVIPCHVELRITERTKLREMDFHLRCSTLVNILETSSNLACKPFLPRAA